MATEEEPEIPPPLESLAIEERPLFIPDLTVDRVQNATYYSRRHLEEWIANAERAWLDEDREKRLEAQQCRWCFYAMRGNRLVQPAFHKRGCESCKEVFTFSSSHTTPICKPCGKKLSLCVECRADIALADRRKLERKLPPDHVGGSRVSAATSAKRKANR